MGGQGLHGDQSWRNLSTRSLKKKTTTIFPQKKRILLQHPWANTETVTMNHYNSPTVLWSRREFFVQNSIFVWENLLSISVDITFVCTFTVPENDKSYNMFAKWELKTQVQSSRSRASLNYHWNWEDDSEKSTWRGLNWFRFFNCKQILIYLDIQGKIYKKRKIDCRFWLLAVST